MSFSENPYRWFEFFNSSDGHHVVLHCSGCGHESDPFPDTISAGLLMEEQREHVMESHGRSLEDFADWSQPNHRDKDVSSEIEPQEPAPVWLPAEWRHVLSGDHVRIGQQEADVETSNNSFPSTNQFHVHEDGWVWDEQLQKNVMKVSRWDHKEISIKLAHLDSRLSFPPGGPVEILMNRERQALHLLQTQLDATPVQK